MKNLTFLILVLVSFIGKSQTISAPLDLSLNMELLTEREISAVALDTLINPMSILSPLDTMVITAIMETPDTTNLLKIHIKLGTTEGGSELLDHSFDFDAIAPGGLFTYYRKESLIMIGLGQFPYINNFFCEVYFEDVQGTNSSIIKYQSN